MKPLRARLELALLALALVLPLAGAATRASFPFADAATFEYVGAGIARGGRLYADLWDNKPPSIYLLNALWNTLFGARYMLHAVAEACIAIVSVALFAVLLRRAGSVLWTPAALVFALVLSVPMSYDTVENAALPLMLLAYVCWYGRKDVLAGAALALATMFWVTSVVLLAPLLLDAGARGRRAAVLGGYVATLAAFVALWAALWGPRSILEIVASWYPCVAGYHAAPSAGPAFSRLFGGLVASGCGALVAVFAAFAAPPRASRERFALLWCGATLVAVLALQNFFDHHFLPLAAALIFATAVFAPCRFPRPLRCALCTVLAVFFAWCSAAWETTTLVAVRDATAADREVGTRIRAAYGPGVTVAVDRYEPAILLAAGAALPNRFALVPRICGADPDGGAPPRLLVLTANAPSLRVPAGYVQRASLSTPRWRVYATHAPLSRR